MNQAPTQAAPTQAAAAPVQAAQPVAQAAPVAAQPVAAQPVAAAPPAVAEGVPAQATPTAPTTQPTATKKKKEKVEHPSLWRDPKEGETGRQRVKLDVFPEDWDPKEHKNLTGEDFSTKGKAAFLRWKIKGYQEQIDKWATEAEDIEAGKDPAQLNKIKQIRSIRERQQKLIAGLKADGMTDEEVKELLK